MVILHRCPPILETKFCGLWKRRNSQSHEARGVWKGEYGRVAEGFAQNHTVKVIAWEARSPKSRVKSWKKFFSHTCARSFWTLLCTLPFCRIRAATTRAIAISAALSVLIWAPAVKHVRGSNC